MRLHRARPKKAEELPDYCKCCSAVIQSITNAGELILDLDTTELQKAGICSFCKAPWPPAYSAKDQQGLFCELEFLDIDEAPCPPSV